MSLTRYVAGIFSICGLASVAAGADGQDYPNKPIRFVTSEVGGGTDFAARVIGQALSGVIGQQVVVENRPGTIIPARVVATASPDGYTLLLNGSSLLFLPFMMDKLPYDTVKDFTPVTLAHKSPNVLVLHPSVAVTSVKELIELAKAKQGELNYASSGSGSSVHLAAELFKSMAGVNIVRIVYRGSGPAIIGLMSGETFLMFATPGSAAPHVKSGRLKALAVTSAQPSALFPGLPTVASDLPGYESVSTNGVLAPAGTPLAIINRLNQAIVRVLQRPDVKEKFFRAGSEPIGSSPQQFAATIKSEMAKWGKVIRDASIRAE